MQDERLLKILMKQKQNGKKEELTWEAKYIDSRSRGFVSGKLTAIKSELRRVEKGLCVCSSRAEDYFCYVKVFLSHNGTQLH